MGTLQRPAGVHNAAAAARPFPAPVGLSMAMHVHAHVRTRIRPRLDFSWTGRQCRRGGFGMSPLQCGGGAPSPRSRARMSFEVPYSQKPCVAGVAIAIPNNPVFWVEDVLNIVFNRRRILTENRSRSPIPIHHDQRTLVYLLYMVWYDILSCDVT